LAKIRLMWLNSPPLTPAGRRGNVVLVNFWTYTCINWLRQLPYVRAWAGKYSSQGLVVIGVHTPEFGFEHNPDNVRRAVPDMRVAYPVAIDNDYTVWRALGQLPLRRQRVQRQMGRHGQVLTLPDRPVGRG
jgi:thiol-disulfide isomerase/thioredoxin